jgi:CheY-like chemotaxis protein
MKNASILLIEDEPVTAHAIRKMLENLDYTVAAVIPSGEEALRELEKNRPDLIILDITLAGEIDGIDTAMHINRKYDIPIIYLTANTHFSVIQRAKEKTKSYGYLLKPVKGIDLHWTINTALKLHLLERRD